MKTMALLVAVAVVLGGCASEAEAPDAPAEAPPAVEVETDTTEPAYGSTFASNCFCLACTKYCQVDGTTYKSGTCC